MKNGSFAEAADILSLEMIHLLSLSPYRSKIYLVCESLPATAILLLLRSKKILSWKPMDIISD